MSILLRIYSFLIKNISFVLLLFFTFSFIYTSDYSFDQDLGRHIKLGEIIWSTLRIPQTNLFSYTYPDFPFVNHHWLFEVVAYGIKTLGGIHTLLVIKVLLLLSTVSIILIIAKRSQSIFFFTISFLFLHLLRGRVELRPEIFSFLFTALTFSVLEKYASTQTKLIYVLPIISLVWVNTHIYYPVGIFLQGIYLGDLFVQRYLYKKSSEQLMKQLKLLMIIFVFSLIATLVNPHFIGGALYAFTVFNNYGVTITENQTIATLQNIGFVNPDFLFFYLGILCIVAAILVASYTNKFSFKSLSILGLGVVLSFQSIRGFPYMLFFCLPIVLQYLAIKKTSMWIKVGNFFIGILLIGEALSYLSGGYGKLTYRNHTPSLEAVAHGEKALDFLIAVRAPQPLFNNFDIGSYIIYRTYPEYKVFIDGRPEAYPAEFFEHVYLPMQENYALFKDEEKKRGLKTVLISLTDQNPRTIHFLKAIVRDPDWRIVYLDDFMIMLIKKEFVEQKSLATIDLNTIDVGDYQYKSVVSYTTLSTFLYNMDYFFQAKVFNEKALLLEPNNPAAHKIMANILLRLKKTNIDRVNEHVQKSTNMVFW